ncbi:MAG: HD domain-containing protein, partial [Candidatus Aenigmatarchaeota archaeon]
MKKQFVKALTRDGETVDEKFAVKYKKPPSEYKGADKKGKWFELRLSDGTGEINAKYWGRESHETETVYAGIAKGDIVHVRGTVQEYPPGSSRFSISVDAAKGEVRKCAPGEYVLSDFIEKSKKDTGKMVSDIKKMLSEIGDENLRALADSFTDDAAFMESFTRSPAAIEMHQNYLGGLLEHTLNTMRIASRICDVHADLNRDLVTLGSFLHDIGKVRELDVTGGVIDLTEEGMMIGHITMGYEMVEKKIAQMKGFPKELRFKVLHMMLAHHNLPEYGSPKKPQFPEAIAVHHADHADAEIDIYLRLRR